MAYLRTVFLLLLLTSTTQADTLLASYYDKQTMFDGELVVAMGSFRQVFNPTPANLPPPYVHLKPVPDGTVFNADAAQVASAALTGDNFWVWANPYGKQVATYVPQLGYGFSGYRFTRITRTVTDADYWLETNSPYPYGGYFFGHSHGTIAQTMRFYGELVPEPSTGMLLLVSCAAACVLAGGYRWRQP